jgi:transcriptional regulator with XRE-family HTH domain
MKSRKRGYPKGLKHTEIPRSPFGERLYKTRRSRGLSQTELGNRVGLSQRMVSHYEGDAPEAPPLSTITRIAEILNVTVSYLLGESTSKGIKEESIPGFKKHLKILQNLPPKDQKKVLEYADLLASAHEKSSGETGVVAADAD